MRAPQSLERPAVSAPPNIEIEEMEKSPNFQPLIFHISRSVFFTTIVLLDDIILFNMLLFTIYYLFIMLLRIITMPLCMYFIKK